MSQFFKTKRETVSWLKEMGITNYRVNKDLSVRVMGHVDLTEKDLAFLPVQFDVVFGRFSCSGNRLETLRGAPRETYNSFFCIGNQLKTLEGGPEMVTGLFCCELNPLESLDGLPKEMVLGSVSSPFHGDALKAQIKALAEKGIVVDAFNFRGINAEIAAEALAKDMANVLDRSQQEEVVPKRKSERS